MTPEQAYIEVQPLIPYFRRRYGRMAGRAIEPDDIEQAVYEGMLRLLPKYDPSLGSFRAFMRKALKKWALKEIIKVNDEKQHLFAARKRYKIRSFKSVNSTGGEFNEQDYLCSVPPSDLDILELDNLDRAISRLPGRQRFALHYYFRGKTFREIGSLRGVSGNTIFLNVRHGLQRLQRILNVESLDHRRAGQPHIIRHTIKRRDTI